MGRFKRNGIRFLVPQNYPPYDWDIARRSHMELRLKDAVTCNSLYSGCCRSSVPSNLIALVAYPVVVRFHHARRPCGRSYDRWGIGLTCARSVARPLAPPYLRPTSFPCWVDHVGGPVVRRRDDVAARSLCVISFSTPREDILEVPDEGAEDEVLCLAAGAWELECRKSCSDRAGARELECRRSSGIGMSPELIRPSRSSGIEMSRELIRPSRSSGIGMSRELIRPSRSSGTGMSQELFRPSRSPGIGMSQELGN
ncbi:hypothetical protein B296_00012817 [Ensete ventricosum]|uniref:Uncharacterized protein n=1 Tax=Ensete ventricosum TaxID=4639 RepID=A0A426ZC24_ENSVE|nr:hypothetical protein B296_00012817 [Ensete ventricosum]